MLTKHCAYSFLLLLLSPPLQADALTDGTLGSQVHLTDPHFTIGENLGQRVGNNLFHSFERFNVPTEGSATFTGSLGIQNVLARVTGPTSSSIDGTLRSTISGANLYLMNPNGILFGPNASLDLSGSFHATTADSIRLGKDGQFNAREPSKSLLTVAPPEAFGFLSGPPAAIEVQGSFLQVPEGKGLSAIGGDLTIRQGTLYAPAGRINLISVASPTEINLANPEVGLRTTKLGNITLTQSLLDDLRTVDIDGRSQKLANIDTSGRKGGQVFIRSEQFVSDGGAVFSDTYGDEGGHSVDISVSGSIQLLRGATIAANAQRGTGEGGKINITTPKLSLMGRQEIHLREDEPFRQSTIATDTFGPGPAGEIHINNTQLIEVNDGSIQSAAQKNSTGNAGNLHLQADNFVLKNTGYITSLTRGEGKAGQIWATATGEIRLENSSAITTTAEKFQTGDAGEIHIDTRRLTLSSGSFIDGSTWGKGISGKLFLNATEAIFISGHDAFFPSMIATGVFCSLETNCGIPQTGGQIEVTSPSLELDEGVIQSLIDERDIGMGGNIYLNIGKLVLKNGGQITSESYGAGHAGNINIIAPQVMLDRSQIATKSQLAGGGNIYLSVNDNLFLFNKSRITAQAGGNQPGDNGGNLTIRHPHLFIMDQHSKLSAQANAGHGGNILIEADNFINPIPENVTASSEKGIDGEVTINAFQPNLAGLLTTPLRNYLRLGLLEPPRWCGRHNRYKAPTNSFAIRLQEMLEPSPADLRFFSPVW